MNKQTKLILEALNTKHYSHEEAKALGDSIGVDWNKTDVEQFHMGLNTELEHGKVRTATNVTDDNDIETAKIALAHLNEIPDYYTKLKKMENQ